MIKRLYYQEILIFILFVFITLFVMYPAIFSPFDTIYGFIDGTDNRGTIWRFWWMKYSHNHHLDYNVNSMIAYPFGETSTSGVNPYIFTSFYKSIAILFNEIFAYNFGIFLSFILSAIFIYFIVFKITKNKVAGFISGLIFAFCPYHFNKSWEHFTLAQIQWIPLYVLSLLSLNENPSLKTVILGALAFTLVMSFDFYYAYIMSIFTLAFMIYVIFYRWKDKFKNFSLLIPSLKTAVSLFFLLLLVLLINIPLLLPIFKMAFFSSKDNVIAINTYSRSFSYLFSQSARPLSYLLPAVANPVLGKITKPFLGSIFYGRNTIEHTLYLGWLPLILSFIAYLEWREKRVLSLDSNRIWYLEHNFIIGFFIFSSIVAFLFSLPPYINLGIFKIYFPSYFMYKILPMFRAYARFGIIVTLCVSVLAGLGIDFIFKKIKNFSKKVVLTLFFVIIIAFEFNNTPPFKFTDTGRIPEVYVWLSREKKDFAIVEYPMDESSLGEAFMNYDYLFYQRVHQKKLINGAQLGTYAYKIKEKIMEINQADTAGILKWLGAKYAIVHLDLYRETSTKKGGEIVGVAPDLSKVKGLNLVRKFNDVEVYEITAAPYVPKVE